jgi:hypothetical protein
MKLAMRLLYALTFAREPKQGWPESEATASDRSLRAGRRPRLAAGPGGG